MIDVTREQAVETLARIQNPVAFAHEILGIPYLTPDQVRVMESVMANKRTAVTAGHALGKTHLASALVLWFMFTRPNSKILTTASSWPQVEDALWREIRGMHRSALMPLGGRVLNTEINVDTHWFAQGRSTDDSTNLQGFHAPYVMVLLDEATGIDAKIWEAVESLAVGPDDKLVALGNPTDSTSRFFDECAREGKWNHLEVSCENHPNVLEDRIVVPGAVTRDWVDQMAREYGRDHPVYEARVLGRWSAKLGRMFPDFDPLLGGAHVYPANSEQLAPWLPKWISIDWGYAHDTAAYLFCWDGAVTWVLDEICVSGRTPAEIANMILQRWGHHKIESVFLSHDAMNRTEGPKTRATLMSEVWSGKGMPFPTRSDTDRVGRWNLMTQMFRLKLIKISSGCQKLIAALVRAVRDPDHTEDMLKFDGDDPIDGVSYGLKKPDRVVQLPVEERLARAVAPAIKRKDPMGEWYLRAKFLEQEKKSGASRNVMSFGQRPGERKLARNRRAKRQTWT